jgi:hypothetical protein
MCGVKRIQIQKIVKENGEIFLRSAFCCHCHSKLFFIDNFSKIPQHCTCGSKRIEIIKEFL